MLSGKRGNFLLNLANLRHQACSQRQYAPEWQEISFSALTSFLPAKRTFATAQAVCKPAARRYVDYTLGLTSLQTLCALS